ncbi:gamma-crystallin B-like [Branchiostoma floridae x Branchiostoma japonicum]
MATNSISIYDEEGLRGTKHTFSDTVADVPAGQNSCFSIKVTSGEWLVYSYNDFEGTTIRLPPGIYPDPGHIRSNHVNPANTTWNDMVRSLRPIRQDAVTLYDKDDFRGAEQVVTCDDPDVEMDNCCSLVVRGAWWSLYPYGSYSGGYPPSNMEKTMGPGNYRVPLVAGGETITIGSIKKVECPYGPWPFPFTPPFPGTNVGPFHHVLPF